MRTLTRAREQALQHAQEAHDRLNTRIEAMYLDKLDGRITAAFYDEKATAWRQEQTVLQRRINELRTTSQNYNEAINASSAPARFAKKFPAQPAAEQPPQDHRGESHVERRGVRNHPQKPLPRTASIEPRK